MVQMSQSISGLGLEMETKVKFFNCVKQEVRPGDPNGDFWP